MVVLYVAGILAGIFIGIQNNTVITPQNVGFFKVFCLNYVYIFFIWLLGFSIIGLIFDNLIVSFRAFLFGMLLSNLKTLSIKQILLYILLDVTMMFPVIIYLSYLSISSSISIIKRNSTNRNKYVTALLISVVVIAIYAICIIQSR